MHLKVVKYPEYELKGTVFTTKLSVERNLNTYPPVILKEIP